MRRLHLSGALFALGFLAQQPSIAGLSDGDPLWRERFGVEGDQLGSSVTVASDGTSFLTGSGPLTTGGSILFVAKFDFDGSMLWSHSYGVGTGRSVSATPDGGVLVTGNFEGTVNFGGGPITAAGETDIFVLRLGPEGSYVWSRRFGGPLADRGVSVAVASDGGALVTGWFQGTVDFGGGAVTSAGAHDVFALKLATNGNPVWSKCFGASDTDDGNGIAGTLGGGAVVTGQFFGSVDFGGGPLTSAGAEDIFVVQLGPNGTHIWSRRFGDPTDQVSFAAATSPDGGVLVTGYMTGTVDFGGGPSTSQGYDIFVLKLGPGGNHVWSTHYGAASTDPGYGIAATSDGGALVTGYFWYTVDFGGGPLTSAGMQDIFVLRLRSDGAHFWSRRFGGPGSDRGQGIAAMPSGDVLVTGTFSDTADFGRPGFPDLVTSAGGLDIFLLALRGSDAPLAIISGHVLDGFNWRQYTGRLRPIAACTVEATDLGSHITYSTTTDADGYFALSVWSGAAYECDFSHRGYWSSSITTPELQPGEILRVASDDTALETKTVVLLHGVGKDSTFWTEGGFDFPARLASLGDYNIESPSLVHGGLPAWLLAPGSVNGQVDVLTQFFSDLDAEGIRSVTVIAHSMGGLVARQYIRSHPGKVSKLIMLGTPNHGSELAAYLDTALLLAEVSLGSPVFDLPPASVDLEPNSALLRDLNYGGASGLWNVGCPTHPDETTLSSKTVYYTYAGTAYDGATSPSSSCDPSAWWRGHLLAELTNVPEGSVCNNDFAVPAVSVPLHSVTPLPNVHNWTDISCACASQHVRTTCPPMTKDDCVIEVVDKALAGDALCLSEPREQTAPEQVDPMGQNAGFEVIVLAPSTAASLTIPFGSADSLELRADLISGLAGLSLVDPTGRVVTPDSAATDPDIDYSEDGAARRYVVRSGANGDWQLVMDAMASPDSVVAMLRGTEYGGVAMRVDVENAEVLPNGAQRIETKLRWLENPILGAVVEGAVSGPGGFEQDVVLVDDGTNGDQLAGDGIYATELASLPLAGQYDSSFLATGTYGAGGVLNRRASRPFFVAVRPDLELLDGDIAMSAAVVDTETVVTVSATVRNIGPAPADSVRVTFLEQDTGLVFAERELAVLGPGQEAMVSADWPARRGAPQYKLGARVSAGGSPGEQNLLNNEAYGTPLIVVGVSEQLDQPWNSPLMAHIDLRLELFPNPVRGTVSIHFTLPRRESVRVEIFDVGGRRVRSFEERERGPGSEQIAWDAQDGEGRRVAAGIYFVRLQTPSSSRIGRVVLVR